MTESTTSTYSCRHCGKPLERDWVLGAWFDPDGSCRCHEDPKQVYHRAFMGGQGMHEPVRSVTNGVHEVPRVQPVKTNSYEGDTL